MARRTKRCVHSHGVTPPPLPARAVAAISGRAAAFSLESLEQRSLLSFSWTPEEVYLSELVNRARANPAAEATRLGIDLTAGLTADELSRYGPQEPLALNQYLTVAARAHSLDMATRNFFDHVNPDGQSPTDRVQAAGYGGTAGENIAAGYSTIDAAHRAWMESVGHRKNVLSLQSSFDATFHYDEFGPGYALNAGGAYNNYFTEEFGYPGATHVQYVLGVVFNDANSDNFYGVGEGASGVRIDVASTGAPNTVLGTYTTDAAGNYQIPIGDGSFRVTFTRISDGYRVVKTATLSGQNVKVDATSAELLNPTPPPTDDYPNAGNWGSAASITVDSANGNGGKSGVFETAGDTDLFRFVATQSGQASVTLFNPGGTFAAQLTVFNSQQSQIASGAPGSGGLSSIAQFTVVAGQTYYLLASPSVSTSVGQYSIEMIGPGPTIIDDFANAGDWAHAGSISINATTGSGQITGSLGVAGDTDLFVFTATVTGRINISMASPTGAFAAQFTAFTALQGQIMQGTAGTSANNGSTGQFDVVAGSTYYLLAASVTGSATGTYTLTVTGPSGTAPQDDAANEGSWTTASPLTIATDGTSSFRAGYFEYTGDTDLFRFTSGRTGRTRVQLQNPAGAYATRVRVYGADHSLVGEGTVGGDVGNGSVLDFETTSGLTYYLLCSPMDGTTVGLYTLQTSSLDPAPIVVTNWVLATRDQSVTPMYINGRLTVAFLDVWDRPILGTQQVDGSWTYVDLMGEVPSAGQVLGEVVRWQDTRDHLNYIAMRSDDGLILFRESDTGEWTARNLTREIGQAHNVSADISVIIDTSGRANLVGTNTVGDVIIYCQTIRKRLDGQWRWKFRDLAQADLEPVGVAMPLVASELITWMTPLGTANIAFLDIDGNINVFYKARTDKNWSLGNISQAAGTVPLVGELSVMQMRNRTVQLTGTTEDGHVWVTTFREGYGWSSKDLTARFGADTMRVRSLASYVAKSGYGFIAGIKDNGHISLFRYGAAKNRWFMQDIDLTPPDYRQMAGRLEVLVNPDSGQIDIVGTLDSTRVVRWTWAPGMAWTYQDVSYRLAGG